MRTIIRLIAVAMFTPPVFAANCDKNPSHPTCTSPPPPSVTVEKVIVDRIESEIEVHGAGLLGATATLAGTAIPADASSDDNLLLLPFGPELEATVPEAGNYVITVESVRHAIYIDGAIVDATFTGCPCGDFNALLVAEGLSQTAPDCIIISDNEINSDYLAPSYPASLLNPPVYVIGAAFVAGAPSSSVCQMVKIGAGGSLDYLVSEPVNAVQQSACAVVMLADQRICGQAAP